MVDLSRLTGFNWDKGNQDKNYHKHGVRAAEAEEAFLDKKAIILEDIAHSYQEQRFIWLGKTTKGKVLFVAFTIRKDKIRIISARSANKKERSRYAQKA